MSARPRAGEAATERVALVLGGLMLVSAVASVAVATIVAPGLAQALLLQWGAQVFLGKETGIPAGLAAGSPPAIVVLAGFAQDAVILLLGYGLVLRAGRGVLRSAWLARRLPQPRQERPPSRSEVAGVPLLALTLWIPFLPSGALVAAIIGRAAGYRARLLLPALLVSILLSHAAYTAILVAALPGATAQRVLVLAALAAGAASLVITLWTRRHWRSARSEDLEDP